MGLCDRMGCLGSYPQVLEEGDACEAQLGDVTCSQGDFEQISCSQPKATGDAFSLLLIIVQGSKCSHDILLLNRLRVFSISLSNRVILLLCHIFSEVAEEGEEVATRGRKLCLWVCLLARGPSPISAPTPPHTGILVSGHTGVGQSWGLGLWWPVLAGEKRQASGSRHVGGQAVSFR